MAQIRLSKLRHSYVPAPKGPEDYALKEIDVTWRDGGAYALLGPSGCGKSTLLNIISGLLTPSEGQVLFDDRDVTGLPPDQRNIAQVFQFPVIYDTMTVRQNLAFPLKNRGVDAATIEARVGEIAEMLEVTDMLDTKASNLGPDNKQKISMGRGLVRDDVNVVMFDEPLTVIDPHLKWKLRSKLKELHQKVRATMIYVTHDQTEALTFADEVVVMQDGEVVQIGTPVELFERPQHTFVGHFIGSPGMNVLPCELRGDHAVFEGHEVALEGPATGTGGTLKLGIRPEYVRLGETGLPAQLVKVSDVGRHFVLDAMVGNTRVKAVSETPPPPTGSPVNLSFRPEHTRVYRDGWIATEARP
ncbi:sugar ABC transporter [Dinoroseobacter shibae DFL 12 = DSM 16493]|jgi:glycerol transport system ATP-binding protein|uniref:Sugar ABC transporter n=1 Tax=Dinoroseobacter shibae (strain DSM 16493 / NCIMB 14021 / DFL 12) TaxID=398580 RepID=A8LLV3_DINSH|nr:MULTISPECIES: ABC transporter ATP-binding protein [Dinoroseobacter]ABV94862.1 sugar ABC transporter [Dinoroseobacter shibae DFL 12 = DSM 16493]MDD9716694.1 ABC transporter ATP-binding protein [Dinoroseobacter sp. PD6]URF46283.1 ABC transporter ATP-binding protein [Dinoroseobacter shibae]URF50589.1 ABC transporter ATP-binding protein [Dinoroseobacter shibae]